MAPLCRAGCRCAALSPCAKCAEVERGGGHTSYMQGQLQSSTRRSRALQRGDKGAELVQRRTPQIGVMWISFKGG